jgi:protocatechuate 3,4-dioxygenase beta subunit
MSQVLDHDHAHHAHHAGHAGHAGHELEDHDRGLVFDLNTMDRRRVLKLLGFGGLSASLFTIVGCGPSGATGTPLASAAATAASVASGASCAVIPEETAGPFPGDGSNGPDVLSQDGVVRTDIRSSFGTSNTVAEGVPLAIKLTIQDAGGDCAPLAGAAVYLWHCDRDGGYSLYSQAVSDENYLRGVQEADDNGLVTFQSIFPACYSGRWPHIHFEVYPSLDLAKDEGNRIATSQIALPKDACDVVYATDGYRQSIQNLGQVSLASDNVFRDDGAVRQLGTITGDVAGGLTVAATIPVNPGTA